MYDNFTLFKYINDNSRNLGLQFDLLIVPMYLLVRESKMLF